MNKSIKRKIGEGAFWVSGGSILMKVVGIAYVVFVLRELSVYEYGLTELAFSILLMASILNLSGLQPVIVADLTVLRTQGRVAEMRNLISSYISIRVLLSVVTTILLITATVVLSDFFHEKIIFMVRLLAFSFLLGPIRSLIILACNLTHNFKKLTLFNLSIEVIKFVSVVVLFNIISYGPTAVISAFVFAEALSTLLFAYVILEMRSLLFEGHFITNYIFKPLFSLRNHAKWSVLQGGFGSLTQNVKPWIIQFFLGTEAVGLYGLAIGMFQQLSSLFQLSKVVAPIIPAYLDYKDKFIRLINTSIRYQLIVQFFATVFGLVAIVILINTLFPKYQDSYTLLLLLSVTVIPLSFSRIFETVFHALKLQRNLFLSNVVLFTMTITILPISIISFGLYGIAFEFFVTNAVYAYGRYKVLKSEIPDYNFNIKDLLSISEDDILIIKRIKKVFVPKSYFR